jgi:hypothetical protein
MPMFEIDLPMDVIAANYFGTSPVSGQLFGQASAHLSNNGRARDKEQ